MQIYRLLKRKETCFFFLCVLIIHLTAALMTAIVECDWETVIKVCQDDPDQAKIWHHRFTTLETGPETLLWRNLPIHAALMYNAPITALMAVQSAYPAGVRNMDDKGRLPIHLAFGVDADDEILSLLALEYPDSLTVTDDNQKTPFDYISASSKRSWIKELQRSFLVLNTDRLGTDITTLEETMVELKGTIHDYDAILTRSSESIETDFDQFHGTVRVTEKFRVVSQ